jgi:hypothetical protein
VSDGGPAIEASLSYPTSVAVDSAGDLFIADSGNFRVRKVSPAGIITTVAGNGSAPVWPREATGDASATTVPLMPTHVAVDGAGTLYIQESSFTDVWKVSADGTIHIAVATATGSPYYGFVSAFTVGRAGDVFLAGSECTLEENCSLSIRKISPTGTIATIPIGNQLGFPHDSDVGDGGPATQAKVGFISGLAVDSAGNLFLSDLFGQRIRRIDLQGIITTVGGNGIAGYSGDGGPAANASLDFPVALAVDSTGGVYVSDFNQAIRLMRPGTQ